MNEELTIPEGWKETDLPSIISVLESGSRPKGGATIDSGEVPSLGGENIIQSGGVDIKTVKKVPNSFFEAMTKGKLKDGDILINKDGANTGKVGIFKGFKISKACINEHLFLIRTTDELLQEYLYYFLLYDKTQLEIKNKISGSAQPGLNTTFINNFKIRYPKSKNEQRMIIKILSKIDEAINQTQKFIAKYSLIQKGMLQELLIKGIDTNGNIRSEEAHEFKESPIGRVPVEWEVEKLDSLLENIEQGWSPQCDFEPANIGEWGVLKTTAVTWDGYDENENKRLPTNLTPRPQYEVKKNDVLMTRGGPNSRVGVVSFVKNTRDKLILSDKLYRLVPKAHIKPQYLTLALSSEATQKHLSTMKTGMAESQTNISQEIVKNLFIKVVDVEEQDRIIKVLSSIEENINILNVDLDKLRKIKTGLMQDLLTGRVRATDLKIEEVGIK